MSCVNHTSRHGPFKFTSFRHRPRAYVRPSAHSQTPLHWAPVLVLKRENIVNHKLFTYINGNLTAYENTESLPHKLHHTRLLETTKSLRKVSFSAAKSVFYLLCILWCSLRKWNQLGNCNSRPATPSTSSLSHTPSRSYMVLGLPSAILRTRKFYWDFMFPLDSLNKQSAETLSNRFYRRGENKVWSFDLCCSIVWKIDGKVRFFAKHLFDQSSPTEVKTM